MTDSINDSCLVDFTGVTLAFADADSKLLDVDSVADVNAYGQPDCKNCTPFLSGNPSKTTFC